MSGALTTILLVLSVLIIIAIFYATNKKTNRATSLTQVQMTCLNVQKRAGLKP